MPSTLVEVTARCERIAWKTKGFRNVENMLNSTKVALNLVNTYSYKLLSCRSQDNGCFPKMTRTAMIRKLSTRESHLDIKRRILRKEFLRTHTYVTLEPTHMRSTIHKSSATEQ